MHPALATAIWDISVESDYQMSNWAINRYSFQINIIGTPKKTQNDYSASRPSFLHLPFSQGYQPTLLSFGKLRFPELAFHQNGHCDPKVNSFKVLPREIATTEATQKGSSDRQCFQGALCLWAGTGSLHGVYRTVEITNQIMGCLHS